MGESSEFTAKYLKKNPRLQINFFFLRFSREAYLLTTVEEIKKLIFSTKP